MQTLPFGKFQGCPIESIPSDYFSWLRNQPWLRDDICKLVEDELYGRRQQDDDRITSVATAALSPQEQDLISKGWQRSYRGHYSRSFRGSQKRPGWCVYQAIRELAAIVQNYLDANKLDAAYARKSQSRTGTQKRRAA
jgi:hypothetical protein